jgi:predicted nuclease with TOPRIM domain
MEWEAVLIAAVPGALALAGVVVREVQAARASDRQTAMNGYSTLTDNLQEEVQRLQRQVLDLTEAWRQGVQDNLELRRQIASLRHDLEEMKVKIARLEDERSQLREENGRLKRIVEWLRARLSQYEEIVDDIESQMRKESADGCV